MAVDIELQQAAALERAERLAALHTKDRAGWARMTPEQRQDYSRHISSFGSNAGELRLDGATTAVAPGPALWLEQRRAEAEADSEWSAASRFTAAATSKSGVQGVATWMNRRVAELATWQNRLAEIGSDYASRDEIANLEKQIAARQLELQQLDAASPEQRYLSFVDSMDTRSPDEISNDLGARWMATDPDDRRRDASLRTAEAGSIRQIASEAATGADE
jgi:hypothetical protein